MDRANRVGGAHSSLTSRFVATVLIVDDEPAIRDLVRMNLEMAGHEVVTASDGREALTAVQDHPDLVVLDVMMPEVDGWEVLARMKAVPDTAVSEIPVIMLTVRQDDLARIRGGIEGAIRYLAKPFSPSELRAEVAMALEGDPEPLKRRRAQTRALENLARLEGGHAVMGDADLGDRGPRLTRLERPRAALRPAAPRLALETLSSKQRELLEAVRSSASVRLAAESLGVSRSNVYASLRRISHKLGVASVPELLLALRAGEVSTDAG